MNNLVSIIIPSYNNHQDLSACLSSLLANYATAGLFHIYVVNNGHEDSCKWINNKMVTVLGAGENLGWEGGLRLGLSHIKSPFVCFLNDDTFIPPSSRLWLNQMLQHFKNPKVGAVGPASNVVMGAQSIFDQRPHHAFSVKYLIGFCMLLRTEALEKAGGVDDSLPGGDDLDLSIRLRDNGYGLIADKDIFIFHHGFKTGTRIYGDHTKAGGWNSYEQYHNTTTAIIKKHGLKKWYDLFTPVPQKPIKGIEGNIEAKVVREYIKGKVIVDMGCGGDKTVPEAIGVDMIKKDETIEALSGIIKSQADVVGNVTDDKLFKRGSVDTIIARHILEHLVDPIDAIKKWVSYLKKGGRLIIAVPDQAQHLTIPMNIEHVHAWDKESMRSLIEQLGLKIVELRDTGNYISFITVCEKI